MKNKKDVRASQRTGLEGWFGPGEEISKLYQTVVFQQQMAETQLKMASAKRKKHLVYETVKSGANLVLGWPNPGIQIIFPEPFSPQYSALFFFFLVGFVPRQVLPMPWQMVTFTWSLWPKSAIFVERSQISGMLMSPLIKVVGGVAYKWGGIPLILHFRDWKWERANP